MIDFIALVVAAGCASLIAIIILAIDHISRKVTKMSAEIEAFARLQAVVAKTVSDINDAVAKLSAPTAATVDPAAIDALASQLNAAADALVAAKPVTP
jgi:hypothetical protein